MSDHPDTILLEGIQVPAALGVTAAERKMRRPVRLDLEIETDLRAAGRSDRIQQTIHYKRIFEIAADVASNQEHKLVEALGQRIADAVLDKFGVDAVTVTVRKPSPIAAVLEHAGIRIRRERE
ncbi:MAG: dihydroneopterin aldolase [Deltaproteobacteria bacterium]|nr:dihydroneopterin aldolase [Deltaproteobacteria bacterium]MBW2393004.1 dihydroneopterin aldolase [Deltaproteobacteria bacterium]MCP5055285.1 dihydroneopterin aldolase [bacterium]